MASDNGQAGSYAAAAAPPPLDGSATLENPFEAQQKEGKPKTLKWCIWEVLAHEYPQGAMVAQLVAPGSTLYNLYPKLKTAANPSGQVCLAARCCVVLHLRANTKHHACHPPGRPQPHCCLPSPAASLLASLQTMRPVHARDCRSALSSTPGEQSTSTFSGTLGAVRERGVWTRRALPRQP
jgi:hypothetical protein